MPVLAAVTWVCVALPSTFAPAAFAALSTKPFDPDIGDVHEANYMRQKDQAARRVRARPVAGAVYAHVCRARGPHAQPPVVILTSDRSAPTHHLAEELWTLLAADAGAQRHAVTNHPTDHWALLGIPVGFVGSQDPSPFERLVTTQPGPVFVEWHARGRRDHPFWLGPWLGHAVAEGRYDSPRGVSVPVAEATFVVHAEPGLPITPTYSIGDLIKTADFAVSHDGCDVYVVNGFRAAARLRCELNLSSFTNPTP